MKSTYGNLNSVPKLTLETAKLPLDPRESRKRQRERWTIALLAVLFAVLTFTEIRLTRLSTSLPFVNSIFFFGLINLNIVILSALLWLIFKNVGKLFFERRSKLLGTSLKTKLVTAFIGFSIIPTLTLFTISVLYINSSFDKWFSIKVQNTLQSSLDIASLYYQTADRSTQHFSAILAREIQPRLAKRNNKKLEDFLKTQRELYNVSAIEFYARPLDAALISVDPEVEAEHPNVFVRLSFERLNSAFSGKKATFVQNVGSSDLVRSIMPIQGRSNEVLGIVVVNRFIPVSLSSRAGEITHVVNDYRETNPLRYPIKTTYLVILVLITLLIIFAETWLGLYLAREMTIPIERLVRAADEVGKGHLNISIEKTGHDEIAVLVDSFNRMTRTLREAQTNLEKRSLQMEAILTQIDAGVVLVDQQGVILQINPAAKKLLGIESLEHETTVVRMQDVFKGEELLPLRSVLEKALVGDRIDPLTQSWASRIQGEVRNLSSAATPLREDGKIWGAVAVIDDLTLLVKGQRETAWREVAKRIAHEIKNPLTPIKLSAQRMQRRLQALPGKDGQLVQECTRTIIEHTDELKELVNEFSNFARLPEVNPLPNNINDVINETIHLFGTAHPELHLTYARDANIPIFDFDRDQIKRCMVNLVDNAIAAIKSSPTLKIGQIQIATQFLSQDEKVMITIQDNGPGMPESVQERAFEPYFSTKSEGTGLGLAIVKRIINDHGGYIRIVSKEGEGTNFTIELPLSSPTTLKSEA